MAAIFCPNCDTPLGNKHCGGCGWNVGELTTRDVRVNPYNPDRVYGNQEPEAKSEPEAKPPSPSPTPPPSPVLPPGAKVN